MRHFRTFIIPGGVQHLSRMRTYIDETVCGILIHEHIDAESVRASLAPGIELTQPIYTLNSLELLASEALDDKYRALYEDLLRKILGDPRVHYLATRSYLNSPFNNAIVIEKILVNTLLIIQRVFPTQLISASTPHSVGAWVLSKTFELVDIPVCILERTPINNRAWVYSGIDSQDVVLRPGHTQPAELSDYSRMQVQEQRQAKAGERDKNGFYVSRMDLSTVKGANANDWWSYKRELQVLTSGRPISLPIRLLSVYLKRRLYRSYVRVAVSELPGTPFVVYFMHYQPERSSLPEGLFHVQQWTAIRLLSMALPKGWTLLVREHPTTWLLPLDISARTVDLYDEIAKLPNTQICSMDLDTFALIDNSSAVATLTGSVGFQAILRSKPVIAFGLPAYKDHPACFSIRSATDLTIALTRIQDTDLDNEFTDEALNRYLLWVERNSIVADPHEQDWLDARLKNFAELYRELLHGAEH